MKMRKYTDEELHTLQQIELEILREFIRVCEKLGLDYFADGGTALGAVRHQGFIPWDDDVDVGMTRENYQVFLKEAPALLPATISLHSPYNDPRNPCYYSKLRYNGTKFVDYSTHRLDINKGIYIDIFPFDEVPDDERLNIRQFRQFQRWTRLLTLRQFGDLDSPPEGIKQKAKAAVRRAAYFAAQMIPYGMMLARMDRIATMYNGTGQSGYTTLPAPKRKWDYFRADGYKPFVKMKFETLEINMLKDYDDNLRLLYDDYMQPPPEDQRENHAPYILDFDSWESGR